MPTMEQVQAFQPQGKVEELSWLLDCKECDEADGYAILNKVLQGLATQKGNGNEMLENGNKILRHINKLSGDGNNTTMLERSIRASLSHKLAEGDDHIYAEEK